MISIRYYRIYDIGNEIDLDLLEKDLTQTFPTARTSFLRVKPKSIILENKPVLLKSEPVKIEKEGTTLEFSVLAKIYDIGAISICFVYENPDGTYPEMEKTARFITSNDLIGNLFTDYLKSMMEKLKFSIKNFSYDPEFFEDYTIYLSDTTKLEGDPASLLLGEDADFSSQMHDEVMKNTQSYTKDDIAVLSWDSAILCGQDTQLSLDLIDLIEFANVQVLELRYYDRELTRQMSRMYDDIEHADRMPSFLRMRQYHSIMNQLMKSSAEISEVTEKVHNLIKITEDVYYARIYESALKVMRSGQWTGSVEKKIETIQDSYSMLSDEVRIQHSNFLEWIVIILIAIEVAIIGIQEIMML
ncbi:hypothetical protein J2128_001672 [Methanomicrobium sp. W14]|uniref:hypothetical protein n=1 Tax=Methanomicrobium sp. W14 TaxID=2817839 RepID=UPI001AE93171|nr:hypothetical protein [Methanomicrobium sp. W14]MBP2133718.1 hypothetical protein [Methanomicrobium sp. W14]